MFEINRLNEISEEEQQKISDLTIKVMAETGAHFDSKLDADLSQLEQAYIATGGTIEVVKDGDQIVGCIAVRKVSEDIGEIKRLRLLSEYRGKGLGRELFEKALDFCRESNFKKIILDTTKRNVAALQLFKDNGFVETRREGNNIFLEKDIEGAL